MGQLSEVYFAAASDINTPPVGERRLFFDTADSLLKAKLPDGSVVVIGGGGTASVEEIIVVRTTSVGNITISTPPGVINGVALNVGDLVLLRLQTVPSQNGVYTFNGAGVPLTRIAIAPLPGQIVVSSEGTVNANTQFQLSTPAPIVTGVTPLTFSRFGPGLNAYGYAVNSSTQAIGANSDVAFDIGATAFPNQGFTSVPAGPGGTAFVTETAGAYEYDFGVVGQHAGGATIPLEFALFVNGATSGSANEFRSNQNVPGTVTDVLSVQGHGIIQLAAGASVTLRNRTNVGANPVNVTSVPTGGEIGANVTLTLKKLN